MKPARWRSWLVRATAAGTLLVGLDPKPRFDVPQTGVRSIMNSMADAEQHLRVAYPLTARSYVKLTDSSKLPSGCIASRRFRRSRSKASTWLPKADRDRMEVE